MVPEIVIDPDETVARRLIQYLVEGDTEPLPVRFIGLDLIIYDSVNMNVRRENLSSFSRAVIPDATQGYVEDITTTFPCPDQNGLTIILAVDGGADQTVTFTTGAVDLASILFQANEQLVGATAVDNGSGQVLIQSDSSGENSSISAPTGTSIFVWDTPIAGTGDPELGYVDIQVGDLIEDRSVAEFEFTLDTNIFTLPRRFSVDLEIRKELG